MIYPESGGNVKVKTFKDLAQLMVNYPELKELSSHDIKTKVVSYSNVDRVLDAYQDLKSEVDLMLSMKALNEKIKETQNDWTGVSVKKQGPKC